MFTRILLTFLMTQLTFAPQSIGTVRNAALPQDVPGLKKVNQSAIDVIIQSPSAVVLDPETGQILYKKNHSAQRPVASITKLLTAYFYLQETHNDQQKKITIQPTDLRNGGKHNVFTGETYNALDLLHIALIASDNTAAFALARAGGFADSFGYKTEKLLQSLNLHNSQFIEPTGLDEQNAASAFDIALLGAHIFKNQHIATITQKQEYAVTFEQTGTKRTVYSTDTLLSTDLFTVVAGKTGFTPEAGYCLVIKVAGPNGKEIIIAILGAKTSEDRFQDAKALAWWVFNNFK